MIAFPAPVAGSSRRRSSGLGLRARRRGGSRGSGRSRGPSAASLQPVPPHVYLRKGGWALLWTVETDLLRDDRFWRWRFESIAVRSAMSSQMACTRLSIARIASYRGLCTSSARWTCSIGCGSRADVTLASASRNNPFSLPHIARREWRITFWTYLSLCARWLACGTV